MRTNKAWLASSVALCVLALCGACKEEEPVGGSTTGGTGGIGGASGGVGGGGGVGGASGGVGGASGGTGGVGGASGGVGGASGGAGGMTGGAGGMTGGMGGMAGGGAGGMTGGMGGMGGGGAGGMGGMGGGAPDAGGGDAASFTEVYAIIEAKCGGGQYGCHVDDDGDFPNDLDMHDKMTAFTNLVGVAAMTDECAGGMRVVANDADNSFLIKAIEGTACIDRMPDGEDPLSADEIATFRSWIEGGALND